MKSYCPRYTEEFDKVSNSRKVLKFYAKFKPVYEYIKSKTGVSFNNTLALEIYDSLTVKVKIIHNQIKINIFNTTYIFTPSKKKKKLLQKPKNDLPKGRYQQFRIST